MSNTKEEMLGATTPPVLGERFTPSAEELICSCQNADIVEFCTHCGWRSELSLEDANEDMRDLSFEELTTESIVGKYLEWGPCPMCTLSPDEVQHKVVNIPRSD